MEGHAIKKTVGEVINKAEDDAPEKMLRNPAGQENITGKGGAGQDLMESALEDTLKTVKEPYELPKAGMEGVDKTEGAGFSECSIREIWTLTISL